MRTIMILAALTLASPALAEDLREFCGDRPGLGTPACTVDKGHLQIELGVGDWTLDRQPGSRTDTFLVGDLQLRYGIGDQTEVRLGWTAFGHQRERDRSSGMVDRASRVGDVTVGIKQNLMNPDGDGLSIAVLPEASIPVGRTPIGAGDWGARILVPVDYELAKGIDLQFTPEADAAVDQDGRGRHLAYGSVVGIEVDLTESVSLDLEGQLLRDRDPEQHATMALAGISLDFDPQPQTQFDVGTNLGLNHNTPDVEVYAGISRKF